MRWLVQLEVIGGRGIFSWGPLAVAQLRVGHRPSAQRFGPRAELGDELLHELIIGEPQDRRPLHHGSVVVRGRP